MLIPRPPLRRRAIAVAALLAVAALAGGASIAAAGDGNPKADAVATVSAKDAGAGVAVTPRGADPGVPQGLLVQTRAALDGLVADGAIDQGQADAMQSRVASGSIDDNEVISAGVLDEAQMERVDGALRAIKLSYTGP